MHLDEICKRTFNWTDEQWMAFCQICRLMDCGEELEGLLTLDFFRAHDAFAELNPILQKYLFRASQFNPLGNAAERFELNGSLTERHIKLAEQLVCLGLHLERPLAEPIAVDVVFILGSTVPNMAKRIRFCRDQVLPRITGRPIIMGLSGKRELIPADNINDYLGDIRTASEKPTEAWAMSVLLKKLMPEAEAIVIDADPKPGKPRPDTEDTGMYAAKELLKLGCSHFKLTIVSDAYFPGQVEQIRTGLMKQGIFLKEEDIIFCGTGCPEEAWKNSARYIQTLVSSLAERAYNTMRRLEYQLGYAIPLPFEGPFKASSVPGALEAAPPENREWPRE